MVRALILMEKIKLYSIEIRVALNWHILRIKA